jgi:RHS repeat-associated protein
VTRDNVFLGNLLVASYIASPAGWQYTASDHLGSPRVVFNQSGQLVESHKYWPYGEDAVTGSPGQRLAYCLMERDTESKRYYDHARTHDYALGRFLGPDRIGGRPTDPQSWNRYAYTLGNPMKHVDPDGRVVVGFTGLGNSPASGVWGISRFFSSRPESGHVRVFRHQDVRSALAFVQSELRTTPNQPVILFGHSRGAAASIRLAETLQAAHVNVNLLITIDPVMIDPVLHQRVPGNVNYAANYFEDESSLLRGIWLSGGGSTDVENNRLSVSHGKADDWLAAATAELDRLFDIAMRMREDQVGKNREPRRSETDR